MQKLRVCSLFAGAGGIDIAFESAGCFTVWANENDHDACMTYRLNFPNVQLIEEDIRSVPAASIPDFDILTAGFPCQPFSAVGEEKGFQDARGNLFFEITRIIDAKLPRAVFLENVANLENHDNGRTFQIIRNELEKRGYFFNYLVADAQDYGFPQRRNRVYIVCLKDEKANERFSFPQKVKLEKRIPDIIDFNKKAPAWCYLHPETEQYEMMDLAITDNSREIYRFSDGRYAAKHGILSSRGGVAFTLLAGMGNWKNREPVIRCADGIRKLTPYECFMLQGYPASFSLSGIPVRSAYRQAGNTVCVPVVTLFAEKIVKALAESEENPAVNHVNTVIGTVRNQKQLDICLEKKFYYFPERLLSMDVSEIENVALYMPRNASSGRSRIGYIGKVSKQEILQRTAITEIPKKSDEMYCRLAVQEWKEYHGDFKPVMSKAVIQTTPFW